MAEDAHSAPPSGIKGTLLLVLITSVCSSGFCLFGYDQGVMSGVNISHSYLQTVDNPSALMLGTITALYDVGAVVGSVAAAFSSERLGRKRTLIFGAVVLIIGSVLMAASFGRPQFMVGRIFTGIGIGYLVSAAPVYQSEVAKAGHRGWMVCCQCSTMLVGLMVAYWIDYGMFFYNTSVQWRFPLAFQIVFALYIVVVTSFLPDSPRWLIRHDGVDNPERGLKVLSRLRDRPMNDPAVQAEKNAIVAAISIEAAEEGTWRDLFSSNGVQGHKRFALALGIQLMQQTSGINIITYYSTYLYQNSLGMSSEMSLFLGAWTQVWYVLASFVTWYTIDRVGRRRLFVTMGICLCAVLVAEAVCIEIGTRQAAIGAIVFVWLFEACFTWGWMATVWVYPAEILPLKIRAKGAALAAAADFVGNFVVVEVTPIGIDNLGWRFYLIWAVFNLVAATIVWTLYPETGGVPLEAIDAMFTEDSELAHGKTGVLDRLQWKYVTRSQRAVKLWKGRSAAGFGVSDGSSESSASGSDVDILKPSATSKVRDEHIEYA